jgi:general L-amino acid transport system permease protein
LSDIARGSASSFWYDARVRGVAWQAGLLIALVALIGFGAANAVVNMKARGIPLGFDFWDQTAGFAINQKLIAYTPLSTYGRAFWVGLLNTLLVAALGIILATPLGFIVGVARLSPNWIVARMATSYVEIMRNTPLLLQLLFWYNAVLKPLPGPRQSLSLFGAFFLNDRGLFLPRLLFSDGAAWIAVAFALGVVASVACRRWARATQERTGRIFRVAPAVAALCLVLPVAAWLIAGQPIGFEFAHLAGFNLSGGLQVFPEFAALLFGLVTYTAAFIAEIVRAGLLAVSGGQREAAEALGLHRGQTMRLVVAPQAMRLIIPPLTSQYLNIVKNSSLAVFIGYPDLVQIFAGTVLNQTHAAIQVMAVTMAVYLVISLITSWALNLFNARSALKER